MTAEQRKTLVKAFDLMRKHATIARDGVEHGAASQKMALELATELRDMAAEHRELAERMKEAAERFLEMKGEP